MSIGEALRAAVSQSLVVEQPAEDQAKRSPKLQDFQNFLGFLKESQWKLLDQASSASVLACEHADPSAWGRGIPRSGHLARCTASCTYIGCRGSRPLDGV